MARAGSSDYGAQIKAIRQALGRAEGLKYADGRVKSISQEEFASRVGCHPSAVKKWELGELEPTKESLVAINKIAPPDLRFQLEGGLTLVPPLIDALGGAVDAAIQEYIRPDRAPPTAEEWERLRALLVLARAKP